MLKGAKGVLVNRFNQVLFEIELGAWHTQEVIDVYGKTVKFIAIKYDDYLKLETSTKLLSDKQIKDGMVIFMEDINYG